MPFELGGALSKERTLHTEIALEDVEGLLAVDYYPNRVPDAEKAVNALAAQAKADNYSEFEAVFLSLVAKWDATFNGEPVPLTSEGLAAIGMTTPFLSSILAAIIGESYAGEAKGTRLRKR